LSMAPSRHVLINPLDDHVGNLLVVLVLHHHVTIAVESRIRHWI